MITELHLTVGALDDHERRITNIEKRLSAIERSQRRTTWLWPIVAGVLGLVVGTCAKVSPSDKVERAERRMVHARDACFALAEKHDDREHGCP